MLTWQSRDFLTSFGVLLANCAGLVFPLLSLFLGADLSLQISDLTFLRWGRALALALPQKLLKDAVVHKSEASEHRRHGALRHPSRDERILVSEKVEINLTVIEKWILGE